MSNPSRVRVTGSTPGSPEEWTWPVHWSPSHQRNSCRPNGSLYQPADSFVVTVQTFSPRLSRLAKGPTEDRDRHHTALSARRPHQET